MPDVAASGPATGNASEPRTGFPLDQAISTALDGLRDGSGASNGDIADELTNPEVAKLAQSAKAGKQDAGDSRDGEDAHAAQDQAKDSKDAAVDPKGDDAKAFEVPKHWPAARKEAFAALAPEAQTLIKDLARDLEGGFTRKSQEMSDKVKLAERVSGLFDDRTRAQLRQAGVDEVGAVQYLMGLQKFATDNPTGYIQWAMQSLGVKPETLSSQMSPAAGKDQADPQQQQPTGDPKLDELLADPAVKQLRTELTEAKQVIADIYGRMNARERQEYDFHQSQQLAHRQSLQRVMGDFRSAQDDTGQLAYPHFEAVAQDMGSLMSTNPALKGMPDGPDKLKHAYDMAVWARTDLRQPLLEAEAGRRAAAQEKKRDAERAKRATQVRPAQGAPTQRARTSNIDDAILGAMSKIGM